MSYLMLRYKLKPETTPEQFEDWVRETDYPKMRGLERVAAFDSFRVTKLLIGDGAPAQDYFELFEITDMEAFAGQDLPGDLVQSVMGEFMELVDNPEFNIAEKL